MATDSVDFVDKDDARCILLGLLKHIADPAGTNTNEHLNEVRTRDGKERHVGFTCNSTRSQCFTCTWRPDEQCALWNFTAEALEFGGVFQKVDNFLKLFAGFINASNVFKGHPVFVFSQQFRLGLTKAHRAILAAAARHLAH